MPLTTRQLVLHHFEDITPSVRHFYFTSDEAFPYIPGQFITIHFEHEGTALKRSYSIASMPDSQYIEFAATFVEGGPGTQYLFGLKPGEGIQASGPFGRLVLRDESPKRYILIGTSTGITPYRAMLGEIEKRIKTSDAKVIILLGVRDKSEQMYTQDFCQLLESYPGYDFFLHYSREQASDLLPHERTGYVQSAFDQLNLNKDEDVVYLCGNPDMIDESFTHLKDIGFETPSIRREKYISR